jgi:hypothetical protein
MQSLPAYNNKQENKMPRKIINNQVIADEKQPSFPCCEKRFLVSRLKHAQHWSTRRWRAWHWSSRHWHARKWGICHNQLPIT